MATITLNYDKDNSLITSILKSAILAGATEIATKKQSPLDMALDDVRNDRVTTVFIPKNGKKTKK